MKVFGKPLELYSSILVPGKLAIPINEVDPLSKGIVWTAAPFEITLPPYPGLFVPSKEPLLAIFALMFLPKI
jgi:hypothetical protein